MNLVWGIFFWEDENDWLLKLWFLKTSEAPIKPKFNNFVWVCWFLVKNLINFVPPIWKLHNPYCHKYRFCDFQEKCLTLHNSFIHLLCGRGCWRCWGSNPRSYNSCQLGKIALASTASLLKLSQVRQTLDPAEKQIFFLCEYIFKVR